MKRKTNDPKQKVKKDAPLFSKSRLTGMLLENNYCFPESFFEPSSDKPIEGKDHFGKNQLTSDALRGYLETNYGTGEKLKIYEKQINKIIGNHFVKDLIGLNKSEYLKVVAHFAILSKVKQGWYDLLSSGSERKTKPSLSDHPILFDDIKLKKKLNDAIIRCFHTRLIQGMTENEKKRYPILLPDEILPTRFDRLLLVLDKGIQDLFSLAQSKIKDYRNEKSLPDLYLDIAIKRTRFIVHRAFKQNKNGKSGSDTLRATLIKFASLNQAINDIDAILNLHDEIKDSLPEDIRYLWRIQSESEILPAIAESFKIEENNLPSNLLQCAKLVCKIYIITSPPPEKTKDTIIRFNKLHMEPNCIAISAALLYQDFLQCRELDLHIMGETNQKILLYKTLSTFCKQIDIESLSENNLLNYAVPQYLFKYVVTRYSISVMGLSDFYPSKIGALAHLKVRRKKLELQKETYELLKNIKIKNIRQRTWKFRTDVDDLLNRERSSMLEDSNS